MMIQAMARGATAVARAAPLRSLSARQAVPRAPAAAAGVWRRQQQAQREFRTSLTCRAAAEEVEAGMFLVTSGTALRRRILQRSSAHDADNDPLGEFRRSGAFKSRDQGPQKRKGG